jgi:hypothetical protein
MTGETGTALLISDHKRILQMVEALWRLSPVLYKNLETANARNPGYLCSI